MKKIKDLLIVDDDQVSSYLIASALVEMNIADNIAKLYNGRQAIEYLTTHYHTLLTGEDTYLPALILLDLNMPVMNGFEFLEEFTTQHALLAAKIPVCILSSSAAVKDIKRANSYNLAGYITKPLLPENFLPILEKL